MPLILAIEPDRKQAAKIAALAKNPLHAELVISDSAEAALATLSHRMPDLILTSLLLSPRDESVLIDRLRELDAAGAHVQTLVIPVLGSASRRRSPIASGLLTRLRKSKVDDTSLEGCDPAMFAAQITEYLERAAMEREAHADRLEAQSYREPPPAPAAPAPAMPADLEEFFVAPDPEPAPVAAALLIESEPDVPVFYADASEPIPPLDPEPVIQESFVPTARFDEPVEQPMGAAPPQPEAVEWTRTEPQWQPEPQLVEPSPERVEDVEPRMERGSEDDEPAAPPQLHVWEPDADDSRPRLIRVPDEDLIEEFMFDVKPAPTTRVTLQPVDPPQKIVRNANAERTEIADDTSAADLAIESSTWEKFEPPAPPPVFERPGARNGKNGHGHPRSSAKRLRIETDELTAPETSWTANGDLTIDPELADFVTALETLKPKKGAKPPVVVEAPKLRKAAAV